MPPIRIKKFSNEITKGIARDNNVHMLYHIHRRQEDFNNNHKINPTSVPSIPTVSLPHGSISLTLVTTSTINATPAAGTDIDTATPIASATDTDTEATATDIGDLLPTDPSTPKIPKIPFPSIPPSITTPITSDIPTTATPIQTQNPLSSSFSITSTTTATTTTTSPFQPIPSSGSPNDTKSNNLHVWMFSILAVAILIMILTVLALIYKKRKGKRNTLHSINAGDITDKDKENSSKSNSLTSSINSISSSFKIKKGKIVPGDIHVSSPPVPSIVEEKPHMPTLKRTQTTVSAFQELVDLTDDEHFNLRQSTSSGIYTIASRLSSTPTYVNYDAEEGSSSNVTNVIPLNQERIDTIIPHSNADSGGGGLTRTFASATIPFDTSNNEDNNNQ
ncbi:hypothetical protein RhiirA5_456346 [Rhizophagus irregularis]|uniref:Uncharacterized protein n=1 Tax=Rhizophagus irregularis TaxID=588596 RepID=A0A2N0Q4I5_9GLOM|nr:hypothetical protein RhiirA5_456346 [Rhizophagus irregularis]CAB4476080.1 unnamed protein product [Rhizophagus irregularis]CAB5133429.1 unnamed protein product [Rhizophagus irregularis]CAB5292563.1 unnamed protein product [Rhizophagus irregularis]